MRTLAVKTARVLLLAASAVLLFTSSAWAQAEAPVVRAVLFYSPTCPHCQHVIEDVLPPLYEAYGPQLQIIGVNTLESEGWALYQAAAEAFTVPEEDQVVPLLIVDDTVLVGADQVEDRFPRLIEEGLTAGGVALPAIPGLLDLLPPEVAAQSGPAMPSHTSPSPVELFARDPVGNTLAVIVVLGMIGSMGYVAADGRRVLRRPGSASGANPATWGWLVPVLAVAGLAVASYLSYVETTHAQAVCGPIGDCNTVQQSPYARLFGVLPIGLLGATGYLFILSMWLWQQIGADERRRAFAWLVLFGVAAAGTLFSIYLTLLEPFVIGATCAWCLSSAVIITALLLLTARPALLAAQELSIQAPSSPTAPESGAGQSQ